jgi:hypothetical protein
MEWLAGALSWETNLGILRVRDQSAVARALSPALRAIAGRPQPADLGRSEPRIDRVA